MKRWVGVLAAAVFLVGCGALPKPFQDERLRAPGGLVTLPDGGAIGVRIDPSLPDGLKTTLESALIAAFAEANIPASADPEFSAEYFLSSDLVIGPSVVPQPETVSFTWKLFSADGTLARSFNQFVQGEKAGWLTSDSKLLATTAEDAALLLAGYIQNDRSDDLKRTPAAGTPTKELAADGTPKIYVLAVDGAPGDGNVALYRSLALTLKREGNQVVTSRQDAQYLVKGVVSVSQPVQGKSDVAIIWRVTSGDGKKLGKITQNNRVPADALSNRWGRLALAVAKGAVAGIKGVLRRAGYRNQSQPGLEIPFREKALGDSES